MTTPPPPTLDTVVVQVARLPEAAGDAAFSIVTVDPSVLAANARLDEALDTVPGFSLYRRTSSLGANPTTQGVSLRGIAGSGASRALVTLDGVPQNDPFGGWVIWTALPPQAISAATVVRGAGAGPYGAGALTGVVALQQPDVIPGGGGGEIAGGDLGYAHVDAIAEARAGPVRLIADGSGETSGGWVPVRQGRGAADRPLTLRDGSAAVRADAPLGRAVLSARVSGFEEDRGAGTLDAASRARGVQASLTVAAQPSAGELGWRLQAWADGSDLRNDTAAVSSNRNTATLADDQYATPAFGFGLNAAVRHADDHSSLEIGADLRDADGESREHLYSLGAHSGERTAGGGEIVAGLYAETSRRLGRWLLTGGARVDGWGEYDSRLSQSSIGQGSLGQGGVSTILERTPDRGGAVPTGRIGARWGFSPAADLRGAVYSGFRPATLNELHRPFRAGADATLANPDLSPERLYGAELGLSGRSAPSGFQWDGDVFYNQLADAITNVTVGHGPHTFPIAGFVGAGGTLYQRENAGRVNAYGAEGEAHQRFGATVDIGAAFSWTSARVDGGDRAPQLTGLRPAQTPAATLTATASWAPLPRLSLFGELRYEGARFDDDLNTRRIAAGTGVNARVEWRIGGGLAVYAAADNLLDAAIQTGRSAANLVTYDAPRAVRVGLRLRRE